MATKTDMAMYSRTYYYRHREESIERMKKYYQAHRDERLAYQKEYNRMKVTR